MQAPNGYGWINPPVEEKKKRGLRCRLGLHRNAPATLITTGGARDIEVCTECGRRQAWGWDMNGGGWFELGPMTGRGEVKWR